MLIFSGREAGFPEAVVIMYDYNNKSNVKTKVKVKETDPSMSEKLALPCNTTELPSKYQTRPVSTIFTTALQSKFPKASFHPYLSPLTIALQPRHLPWRAHNATTIPT